MSAMIPPANKYCHRTGFRSKCQRLVTKGHCQGRWTHIMGIHPQTGQDVDAWGCADDHVALLGEEHTRRLLGLQHAVESMRNELVKLQVEAMSRQAQQHREAMSLVPVPSTPLQALPNSNGSAQAYTIETEVNDVDAEVTRVRS